MLEIFNKAREYALEAVGSRNFSVLDDAPYESLGNGDFRNMGEWRLHKQAIKVLKIAMEECADKCDGAMPDNARIVPLINLRGVMQAIDEMERKYGQGWSHEDEWYIKDYQSSSELIDTLGFFRRMGVVYTRQDRNALSETVHLRVSEGDFQLIFNPVEDVIRRRGRG